MKIAFIGGRDIHTLGGIESYMTHLTRELVLMGHEPIVFCESDHNETRTENGIKLIYMKGFKSNLICKPWVGLKATIRVITKEKGVKVVHYNAWPPSMWSWMARLAGKKTLLQGHGFEWRHSKYSAFQQRILKLMERFTAWTNKNIILVSDEQREYFKKKYHRNAYTIPTAVDMPSNEQKTQSEIQEHYGLIPQKYFLFLGRLSKEKNVDYLIWAFKSVKDYKLVIAGTNMVEPEFVDYLKKEGADNSSVVFTGPVYGEGKDWLLRNAYCFCLPSTTEGMSIALLEAMSYKLPIITSDIVPNKEVVRNNAFFVRPENIEDLIEAYKQAIQNKDMMKDFVETNYNIVLVNYTWEKVAKRYVDYLSAIGVN
jgi:glycosyltransferase involved in cell wall biosynthesis